MKKTFLILSVIFLCFSGIQAQIYKSESMQMFLFNQPDAASEAMGRGNAAFTGSPFLSTINPASSMFREGVSAGISGLGLTFAYDVKASYNTYGAGVTLGQYGALSFNLMHFGWEFDVMSFSRNGQPLDTYKPHTDIYSINYSHFLVDGLSAGINFNYYDNETGTVNFDKVTGAVKLDEETGRLSKTAWTVDAGLMNKLTVPSSYADHAVYTGLSFSNLFNSEINTQTDTQIGNQILRGDFKNWDESLFEGEGRSRTPVDLRPYYLPGNDVTGRYLPSVMRFAAVYEIKPHAKTGDLDIIGAKVLLQYQDLLNSRYFTRYSFGAEMKLLDIVSLRYGWLSETREKVSFFRFVSKDYESATYGFGCDVPVKKLISNSLPLTLRFDYTSIANRSDLLPMYYPELTEKVLTSVYTINILYAL